MSICQFSQYMFGYGGGSQTLNMCMSEMPGRNRRCINNIPSDRVAKYQDGYRIVVPC